MKRFLALAAVGLTLPLVLSAAPTLGAAPPYRAVVACGLKPATANAFPKHAARCPARRRVDAVFQSRNRSVRYKVCVRFPGGNRICQGRQDAQEGAINFNRIITQVRGVHKVTWFVKGKRVGLRYFRRT